MKPGPNARKASHRLVSQRRGFWVRNSKIGVHAAGRAPRGCLGPARGTASFPRAGSSAAAEKGRRRGSPGASEPEIHRRDRVARRAEMVTSRNGAACFLNALSSQVSLEMCSRRVMSAVVGGAFVCTPRRLCGARRSPHSSGLQTGLLPMASHPPVCAFSVRESRSRPRYGTRGDLQGRRVHPGRGAKTEEFPSKTFQK